MSVGKKERKSTKGHSNEIEITEEKGESYRKGWLQGASIVDRNQEKTIHPSTRGILPQQGQEEKKGSERNARGHRR